MENFNSIGVIGTGKAASALLRHFKDHQVPISGIWGRNEEKCQEFSHFFGIHSFKTKEDLIKNSAIIFLSVNDSSIKSVALEIAKELQSLIERGNASSKEFAREALKEKTFVHLSGALSASELDSLREYGANILSAHIIQSLAATNYLGTKDVLENIWFSLQGDTPAIIAFEKLLVHCGNQSFIISAGSKPLYHSAMCVFSNYLVTLVHNGFKLLEPAGLDINDAYSVISPLIIGTLENLKTSTPAAALTGPIARGDSVTIEKHINEIRKNQPDSLAFYTMMGIETLRLVDSPNKDIQEILDTEINEIFVKKVK